MKYNLALLAANALFALNYSLFVSVMQGKSLSIGAIYILQTSCTAALTLLFHLFRAARSPIEGRDILIIAATATVSSLGWSYATLRGMSLSSPIDAATIASMGPSLTLIFAHIMGTRKLSGVRIVGIVTSVVGVSILLFARGWNLLLGAQGRGNVLLLSAVVVSAANTLILKPQLLRYGLLRVALYYALSAFVVSLPLFWRDLLDLHLAQLSLWGGFELLLLLLIGSALPLILLFEGSERLSPLHTSLYRYAQPLITSIVVVSRGQAELTAANYVAMAAIVAGGVMVAKGVDRAG